MVFQDSTHNNCLNLWKETAILLRLLKITFSRHAQTSINLLFKFTIKKCKPFGMETFVLLNYLCFNAKLNLWLRKSSSKKTTINGCGSKYLFLDNLNNKNI